MWVFDVLILWLVLFLVARQQADLDFSRILIVTVGIGLGALIIDLALSPFIGAYSILAALLFAIYILMRFCYISLPRAVIALAVWILLVVLFHLGLDRLTALPS